jgi:hypothetical protein
MGLNSSKQVPTGFTPRSDQVKPPAIDSTPVQPPSPDMATIHDDDERLLARIGYKQVMKINGWS